MREILAAGEELYPLAVAWAAHYAHEAYMRGASDETHPVHQAALDRWRKAAEDALSSPDVEALAAAVHRAYCDDYLGRKGEPYWSGGDYNKLDEETKEIDRATVRAVLAALKAAEPDTPQQTHQPDPKTHQPEPECCVWTRTPMTNTGWTNPHTLHAAFFPGAIVPTGFKCGCGKPIRLEVARP